MSFIRKFVTSLRQTAFPRLRALEQELDASRAARATADAELARVQEELRYTREGDARLITGLREQLQAAESERNVARSQVERLEHSLAEAERYRTSTEERIASLEARLEEERSRHEASTLAAETGLAHLQEGQQSLLAQQSELAGTLHQSAAGLLEFLQAAREKPRLAPLHLLLVIAVLSVTVILTGAYTVYSRQDGRAQLAVLQQGMLEMRTDIKRHLANQDQLIREIAGALNRLASDEQASARPGASQHGARTQGIPEPQPERGGRLADIRELQAALAILGFDLGSSRPSGRLDSGTRQALQEFRRLYLTDEEVSGEAISEALANLIRDSADLARADAARYRVSREVLGAIRLGSIRTGVEFTFLMDLARVESSYNPQARAKGSSAAGLFQFKDDSWLEAVERYGADYGLLDYVAGIRRMKTGQQPLPDGDDHLRREVLALRFDPRLSTLLAAESIKHNRRNLSGKTKREPGRTDLYLLHFFGPSGAVKFLEVLDDEPAAIAGDIFPEAAARNRGVFRDRQSQPRTVAEVYRWFDSRFNATTYDERDPG
jgi:hypothetical protein